mmetsp:Transcript_12114/g.31303  ORF Transcript_12114/g.31303 Transcript_12114/m.31303 type:complete len:84 (-) Transcript_12114:332-583(-)
MEETSYKSVMKDMRLLEKQLFGLPVTLDLQIVDGLKDGDKVPLRWEGQEWLCWRPLPSGSRPKASRPRSAMAPPAWSTQRCPL